MRRIILIFLVGVALLTIMVVAPVVGQGSDDETEVPIVVGFDMNPTGNTCPDNCRATSGDPPHCIDSDDCTLGSIDSCVEVSAGDVLQFDVFLNGLPEGDSILGFGYTIYGFPGTLTAQTHEDGTVNLIAQPGASILNFSDPPPTTGPGPHGASMGDMGAAEFNPPFTKGVLGRYTLDVTGVSAGVYGMTLGNVLIGNQPANELCLLYGCDILDASSSPQYYGAIAVDVACGSAPPIITPTPTPTPTPTATVTPTLTPAPTPTPPDLVAGWNHTCYVGADLPISQALADLGASVLAVYRLRPDQGYDKWFPNRLDISTITTVSPYEALFMLMANDAVWPQEPGAASPTGLDLAQGWNSACYCGQTRDVQSATASIAGQYGVLYLLAPGQGWKRFIPARPEISNLAELQRFAAVLVLVSQPEGARWVFDP
jgi:hypothetical protein